MSENCEGHLHENHMSDAVSDVGSSARFGLSRERGRYAIACAVGVGLGIGAAFQQVNESRIFTPIFGLIQRSSHLSCNTPMLSVSSMSMTSL